MKDKKNKFVISKEGKKKLEVELHTLINIVRPKVIDALQKARLQGDLSENADYDAARNWQAEVEAKIKEIDSFLSNAKVVSSSKKQNKIVKLGSKVEFYEYDLENNLIKEKKSVKIVGLLESDPFKNLISNDSLFAKRVLNHSVNDIVEIKTTKKKYKIKILDIT